MQIEFVQPNPYRLSIRQPSERPEADDVRKIDLNLFVEPERRSVSDRKGDSNIVIGSCLAVPDAPVEAGDDSPHDCDSSRFSSVVSPTRPYIWLLCP